MPGSPGTTNSDHTRGAGATARRQCKPSLTPSHSPGRNHWPPDVGQPQPFRHQTGQLSDQVLASTLHPWAAGHTDPHSALGTTSLAGVLAAKATMERFGIAGTILFFGEP